MGSSDLGQLPQNVRERLLRLQQLQNTLQSLAAQRQRLELELSETERALKSLEDVPPERKIYKSVGALLVEKEKEAVVKELTERKELLEVRVKVLGRQEDKTRKRALELQKILQKELGIERGST
ncbi:prefoldin subunit beta [Candidatus Bathyarchaeota archaeon]|nr:MAG: prefoldin subunit beta [Candidatus Bathyarchaeota archaeon]RLI32382.1 MAG: prefoldin subunit beta [Candidatus Bathyarchaeota archaeon]